MTLLDIPSGSKLLGLRRKGGLTGQRVFATRRSEEPDFPLPGELAPQDSRFRPYVILAMGRRDAGKTLFESWLATVMKQRYRQYGVPWFKVAANYYLEVADRIHPYLVDAIMEFPHWARDMLLCIDEIQAAASSRRSMSKSNVNIAQFLTEIRKRRIEVVFTTQFPQVIDYQVLLQVDFFVECVKREGGRAIDLYWHDFWGQRTGKNWRKPWPPQRYQADMSYRIGGCQRIWPLYKTEQVIAPMTIDADRRWRLTQEEWEGTELLDWQEALGEPMREAIEVAGSGDLPRLEPEEPFESLETVVASMFRIHPQGWAATAIQEKAQALDPTIINWQDLIGRLEAIGHKVTLKNHTWWVKGQEGP